MPRIPDDHPEVPDLRWRLFLKLIGALPERSMSRLFGRMSDVRIPVGLRKKVLTAFAASVGIDLTEVERPLREYPSLNAFFVRRLKHGLRAWPGDGSPASPVDGIVGQFGEIRDGQAIQAKGHHYSVADLLGSESDASRFADGSFLTIYLSPRHYHRIHTPLPGAVVSARHLPGALYPVNEPATQAVASLFALNERLICQLATDRGDCAVVAVGAYNVGRISAAFDPDWRGPSDAYWVTNQINPEVVEKSYDPEIVIEEGAQLMAFHLGSTVVLTFERQLDFRSDLAVGMEIRVGDRLTNPV